MNRSKMNSKNNNNNKSKLDDFIKYSGIAFEMIVIIVAGVFLGYKTDMWLSINYPVFTILFLVLSVLASIYHTIRKFL